MTLKLLSIHPFYNCNLDCPYCYNKDKHNVKAKPKEWFLGFPKVASELGIKQIALGGGEIFLYPDFIKEMVKECKKYDVKLNITTNGQINLQPIEDVNLISVSVDAYKVPDINVLGNLLANAVKVKSKSFLGINLLLDDKVYANIYNNVKFFLGVADFVYILQMKPNNLSVDPEELKTRLLTLSSLYPARFFVDDSLKLSLGLQERCGNGVDMVSIGADGAVSPCSFDEPFAMLDKPDDLKVVLQNHYPMTPIKHCPFLGKDNQVRLNAGMPRPQDVIIGSGLPC